MMAFVSSFSAVAAPGALRSSSICGARVASAPAAPRAAVTMSDNSISVPFLPKPAATVGLLGSAEFDPLCAFLVARDAAFFTAALACGLGPVLTGLLSFLVALARPFRGL
jgi:hypothetical protein